MNREVVIASDSEATQTKPHVEAPWVASLSLAMTDRAVFPDKRLGRGAAPPKGNGGAK